MRTGLRVTRRLAALSLLIGATAVVAAHPEGDRRRDDRLDRGDDNHYILCLDHCPDSGSWVATGNLVVPRADHTATLLRNGKVLVAGGTGQTGERLNSAELYDPATGRWSLTGPLAVAHARHTATLLANGKVLVAGGESDNELSAELYDPDAGTWTPTGMVAWPHASATATLLLDGRVLLTGTPDFDPFHAAELYDPVTGAWSTAPAPRWGRSSPTATLLRDGRVLVAGGIVGSYDPDFEFPPSSNAEVFDATTDTWTSTGAPLVNYDATATVLSNGNVLLAGGWNVVACRTLAGAGVLTPYQNPGSGTCSTPFAATVYDQAVTRWTVEPMLPVARAEHTVTELLDGQVLLAGGDIFAAGDDADLYDPATHTWSATSPMNARRVAHTATLLPNGDVLVAGGWNSAGTTTTLGSAELFHPLPTSPRGR